MKLVKLHKGHKLFRNEGCTYAWKFHGFCREASELEQFLIDKFGNRYSRAGSKRWASGYGANARVTFKIEGFDRTYTRSSSIYWVGIKDPQDLTLLLLQINNLAAT